MSCSSVSGCQACPGVHDKRWPSFACRTAANRLQLGPLDLHGGRLGWNGGKLGLLTPLLAHLLFKKNCFHLFLFLGPLFRHREIPRLGVESELQLLTYARATATRDPSHVSNLHHSSWQHRIVNPLSKARDRTHNLMVPSRIH